MEFVLFAGTRFLRMGGFKEFLSVRRLTKSIKMSNPFGDDEIGKRLQEQHLALCENRTIYCFDCGKPRGASNVYRCLYCRACFCLGCAEHHFGATVKQDVAKARLKQIIKDYLDPYAQNSNTKEKEGHIQLQGANLILDQLSCLLDRQERKNCPPLGTPRLFTPPDL